VSTTSSTWRRSRTSRNGCLTSPGKRSRNSRDGTIGQFTNIYALIRLVTAGRIHVLPASPCASLDLVPIDHVIGGLTDIAERMAAVSGRTYHLVSGAPVPVASVADPGAGLSATCTRRASCRPKPSNGPG
jgi:hypothetical protein